MRTSCIIDNFNHGRFVVEAVKSALAQSKPFDEIIVVDDASTDNSRQVLEQEFVGEPRVRLIFRDRNEGQLACLQTGILTVSGEICCLLDGDDTFAREYLCKVAEVYQSRPEVDSVFVACPELRSVIERCLIRDSSQQTGFSVALTWLSASWIGGPTSCLSFRKSALDQLFPYPHLSDWKVRADDYLNFASSMSGAIKFYLAQDLVRFRWHDRNQSHNCGDVQSTYRRRLAINRLQEYSRIRFQLNPERLIDAAHREFQTWQQPSFRLLKNYLCLCLSHQRRLIRMSSQIASIVSCYLRAKLTFSRTQEVALPYAPKITSRDGIADLPPMKQGVSPS